MRILHLLDASAGWEQRAALTQLLRHGGDHFQCVATIDELPVSALPENWPAVERVGRRFGLAALAGPGVRAIATRESIDVVHSWGVDAAVAASAALDDGGPLVVTVYDAGLDSRRVRILRTIARRGGFGVACAADRVRRRLVEQGVPLDCCALVRPGVDFAGLAGAARRPIRQELGLPEGGPVVLAPVADADRYGHLPVIWSVMMRSYLDPHARIIIPGVSPFQRFLKNRIADSDTPQIAVFTDQRYRFDELLAAADFLAMGTTGDVSTCLIAWAMAASLPVISPATYAVTELISNDLNGILFKAPQRWTTIGARICALYHPNEKLTKIKEVARGQAYEVFGLRRFVRQSLRLYENLAAGRPPHADIQDPALTAA